jgi:hypothetical protein
MNRRIYSVIIKLVVYNQIRHFPQMFRRHHERDTFLIKHNKERRPFNGRLCDFW